jgi:hypothetical protein
VRLPMAATMVVLLHSPLVGPLAWQPVADVLRGRGHQVAVPDFSAAFDNKPPFYEAFARAANDAIHASGAGQVLLVPHSGAGPLMPSVVAAATNRVEAIIFADAHLPHPGRSWFDRAPDDMAQQLRRLSAEGLLPPWNEWFPPGTLEAILPDAVSRSRFMAELPRLPLAFFQEPAPISDGWERFPCGYLRLSQMYDVRADQARELGWPVSRYEGHHLSMLTDPHDIAGHLEGAPIPPRSMNPGKTAALRPRN